LLASGGSFSGILLPLLSALINLVKTLTSKPVNQFPTGDRFSERITGYRIYCMSGRHVPGNADGGV